MCQKQFQNTPQSGFHGDMQTLHVSWRCLSHWLCRYGTDRNKPTTTSKKTQKNHLKLTEPKWQ